MPSPPVLWEFIRSASCHPQQGPPSSFDRREVKSQLERACWHLTPPCALGPAFVPVATLWNVYPVPGSTPWKGSSLQSPTTPPLRGWTLPDPFPSHTTVLPEMSILKLTPNPGLSPDGATEGTGAEAEPRELGWCHGSWAPATGYSAGKDISEAQGVLPECYAKQVILTPSGPQGNVGIVDTLLA